MRPCSPMLPVSPPPPEFKRGRCVVETKRDAQPKPDIVGNEDKRIEDSHFDRANIWKSNRRFRTAEDINRKKEIVPQSLVQYSNVAIVYWTTFIVRVVVQTIITG